MRHWGLFTNSFGKMLHPVLWIFGLVVVLGESAPGLIFLFNTQWLRSISQTTTPQAMLTSLTPLLGTLIVLGAIGFVFATFGDAALIHLINKLEMRERVTVGMGLDGSAKIFQLLVVRVLLILPNLLVVILAAALVSNQFARITPGTRVNALSGLLGSFCGIVAIGLLVSLLTSALSVGAERAIVIEQISIGKALSLSGQLLATQLGNFIMIGLIFLGLSFIIGVLFSCVGQPLLGLMFRTASPTAMLSGGLFTNPILLLSISFGLIENLLATILVTSVWTLAYREWRADRLPALPRNDFDDQMA
ncbi:MAG TPA: hypothetical protein VMP08_21440 [Anaerolineae bacterium]|nr:hypothetical protein [Anaerolineae bacterium]